MTKHQIPMTNQIPSINDQIRHWSFSHSLVIDAWDLVIISGSVR